MPATPMASGLLSGLWISQLHMMGKIPGAALRKERLSLRGESCDKAPKGHQQRCSQLRPMELSRCFLFSMTKFEDANFLYEAGTKAIKPSPYKYGTQLFEMNHLLETAKLQRAFQTGTYEPQPGVKFEIKERGHERFITSTATVDKAVSHLTCVSNSAAEKVPAIRQLRIAKGQGRGVPPPPLQSPPAAVLRAGGQQ